MENLEIQISNLRSVGRKLYNDALSYRNENEDPGVDNKKLESAYKKWSQADKLEVKLNLENLANQTRK